MKMASFNGTISADVIRGGLSADYITGNADNDTLYGGGAIAVIGDGNDTIYGNTGNDLIFGNTGDDLLYGDQENISFIEGFNDTIYGGLGQDQINGNRGNDYIAGGGGVAHAADDADYIIGGLGYDFILGNGGNDTIVGDESAGDSIGNDDIIYGGLGDDLIYGSNGYDAIVGQNGNDTMGGGIGKDTFFVFSNNNNDVILDFEDPDIATYSYLAHSSHNSNQEWRDDYLVIEKNINGTGIDTFAELQAASSVVNGNLVFNLGSENSLTLNGVTSIGAEDVLWWDGDDIVQNFTLQYYFQSTDRYGGNYINYKSLDYYERGENGDYMSIDGTQETDFVILNEDTDNAGIWIGGSTLLYFQANIDGSSVDTYEELMALNTGSGRTLLFEFPDTTISVYDLASDTINLSESQVIFYDKYDYIS